jgi:hypothetical protein
MHNGRSGAGKTQVSGARVGPLIRLRMNFADISGAPGEQPSRKGCHDAGCNSCDDDGHHERRSCSSLRSASSPARIMTA